MCLLGNQAELAGRTLRRYRQLDRTRDRSFTFRYGIVVLAKSFIKIGFLLKGVFQLYSFTYLLHRQSKLVLHASR